MNKKDDMDDLLNIIKEENAFYSKLILTIINLEQEKFDKLLEEKLEKNIYENFLKQNPESPDSIGRDLKKSTIDCLFSLIIHSEFKKENIEAYMEIISSQIRPELLLITLWSQNEQEVVCSVLENKSIPITIELVDVFYSLFSNKIDTYKADMPIGTKERDNYIANLKNELVLASRYLALNKELKTTMKKGDQKDRPISKV